MKNSPKNLICIFIGIVFSILFSAGLSATETGKDTKDTTPSISIKKDNDTFLNENKLFLYNLYSTMGKAYGSPYLNLPAIYFKMKSQPSGMLLDFTPPREKRLGRALVEGLAHFAYGTSSYWIRQDQNAEDWEFHFTWKEQWDRIFKLKGVRFDSNSFSFNWTHSLAGAMYYQYARQNNLSSFESFLYTFGCSLLWESFVEYKEVVSINDMITTPFGGLSIGEPFYHFGRYFRGQPPSFTNRILRLVSNPFMALNEWLDRKQFPNQYKPTEKSWHDFRLIGGPRFDTFSGQDSNSYMRIGLDTQIIHIPEYGEVGTTSRSLKNTVFTELNFNGVLKKSSLHEYSIFAKAILFGYFTQHINSSAEAQPQPGNSSSMDTTHEAVINWDEQKGHSFFVGLSTAFDLFNRAEKKTTTTGIASVDPTTPDMADQYCIINVLGPAFDLTLYKKALRIRLTGDAYADFGQIHSVPFKKYAELNDVGITKCTLAEHGYYYAMGVTLSSMLQVNYSNIELKGNVKYHSLVSIDGRDRFQRDITPGSDFNLKDRRTIFDLSLGYQIPGTPIQMALGIEKINRWGSLESFKQTNSEKRSYINVRYLF